MEHFERMPVVRYEGVGGMTTAEPAEQKSATSDLSTSTYRMARRILATDLVRGALFLVVGLVMFLWPTSAFGLIKWLMVVLLALQGVLLIVEGANRLGEDAVAGAIIRFVLALVAVVAVLALLIWPGASIKAVLNLIAVWALLSGLIQGYSAFRRHQQEKPGWDWEIAIALLWVLFGAMVLIKPLDNLVAVTIGLSVYLTVTGVVLLVASWSLATRRKRGQGAETLAGPAQPAPPRDYGRSPAGGANVGDIPTTPNQVINGPR
jgi:uncharacterized membrane protein HdeD (DUF308 family)